LKKTPLEVVHFDRHPPSIDLFSDLASDLDGNRISSVLFA
jgi:hypothetical protein